MQRPPRPDIQRQLRHRLPVVLQKEFLDVVARTYLVLSADRSENVSTWPSRKLANALPLLVTLGRLVPVVVNANEPVGLGGETVFS